MLCHRTHCYLTLFTHENTQYTIHNGFEALNISTAASLSIYYTLGMRVHLAASQPRSFAASQPRSLILYILYTGYEGSLSSLAASQPHSLYIIHWL